MCEVGECVMWEVGECVIWKVSECGMGEVVWGWCVRLVSV